MSCRICFESDEPLYTPCRCDGSIKHIHEECLQKWIKASSDRSACELCKETYRFDYNQPLEKDVLLGPLRNYFIVNPSWHIAAFCSIIIIVQRYFQLAPSKHLFVCIQLTYHIAYLSLWYIYSRATIQDQSIYYHHIKRGYGLVTLVSHGTLLITLIVMSFITTLSSLVGMAILNQCFLGIYPILHCMIVNNINQSRKIVIKNR
jgi:hypothetical protein